MSGETWKPAAFLAQVFPFLDVEARLDALAVVKARDTYLAERLAAAIESADPFPLLRALLADLGGAARVGWRKP